MTDIHELLDRVEARYNDKGDPTDILSTILDWWKPLSALVVGLLLASMLLVM